MLAWNQARHQALFGRRAARMSQQLSTGAINGAGKAPRGGTTLAGLPKSNAFTSNLPADKQFPAPADSYKASRQQLGPRMVKDALFTYVRPEEKEDPELYGVSETAMQDIGLQPGEEKTDEFQQLVAGNKILWDPENKEGIYPWAQCYGGWQFGSWAGQLGDGRAISLFESTNPETKVRYEIQLKGAGITPYSRFADGKAVVRSSVREFIVSEALNALKIPTTRALSLTLTRKNKVMRERIEPGAIVCRFAQSWLRIGTFDILRARGDRKLIRRLSDYLGEHVFGSWDTLPSDPMDAPPAKDKTSSSNEPVSSSPPPKLESPLHLNRYARLYRHIALLNARTVAAWQAYGFTNGVLNTDNTSLMGLSLDFGPFAFVDNFDPSYTPNHDDHALRYAYRSQPSVIWWNLVRLGESLGEMMGAGPRVDDATFMDEGVSAEWAPELVARAEAIIYGVGRDYRDAFLAEYKRLMAARLGLKGVKEGDFEELYSELLDTLEALELDFSRFFRKLGAVAVGEIATPEQRRQLASIFFHDEGMSAVGVKEDDARERLAKWLERWRARAVEDWGEGESADAGRKHTIDAVNPKFVPRGWVLDEVIRKVEHDGDKDVLARAMRMAERPFEESWGGDRKEEERWCGDVPRERRALMCSCSS